MKTPVLVLLGTVLIFALYSCESNKKEVITKRIQYDVGIKSPDPEYDWWIQNLVGPQREMLVNFMIDGVLSGKYQAYDYFSNKLTSNEVRQMLSDTMVLRLMEEEPPYEYRDTMVVHTIERADILRIRFVEEWSIVPENLQIEKKVLGIGPVARRFDQNGNERWQPLFWIYTDKNFLDEITNKEL